MTLRRVAFSVMALGLVLSGCPDDSAVGAAPDVPGTSGGDGTSAAEDPTTGTATGVGDDGLDTSVDTGTVDTGTGEDELPAFFGEPCSSNEQCVDDDGNEGWCVQVDADGNKECTIDCIEDCPDGYGCVAIQNATSDSLFVCMPELSTNCNECEDDGECIYENARCIEIGQENGESDFRCAQDCEAGAGVCGDGFDCVKTALDDGTEQSLCIPSTKSCICFGQDENGDDINGSSRTCTKANEGVGTCTGTEICDGEKGWSGCTAPDPVAEVCDSVDND